MSWEVPGYRAEELVGFGATGEVWRGREKASGELVALKRLRVNDAGSAARLRREGTVLASLQHPHLLRLRETVTTAVESVLVLDYAAGGSLAALLRTRGRLRPGEVVTAVAPIAAALAYVHGEGLVHGDVTASNILLTPDGRPLLADLGMARLSGETGSVHVTPEYADPVVARGSAPAAASDVFAVAAVAFHALTGVPPWSARTAEDALALAVAGERPPVRELVADLPEAMVEILERALAMDPAARGTAAEFALDLRHSCPPEPIQLPGRTAVSSVPEAARPASLTHAVRTARAAPLVAARADRHRLWRRVGRIVRSPGLRAVVLAVVSIAVAVRLGVAWAGSGGEEAAPGGQGPAPTGAGASQRGPAPASSTEHASTAATAPRASSASSGGPAPAPPDAVSLSTAPDWKRILDDLDQRRAEAFASADPAALRDVYVAGSDALASDTAQVQRLSRQAVSAEGVRHEIGAVQAVRVQRDQAVVLADEALRSYRVRSGTSERTAPGTGEQRYRITLEKVAGTWRIYRLSIEGGPMD